MPIQSKVGIHQRVAERVILALKDCLVHDIHTFSPDTCTGCRSSLELVSTLLTAEYGPIIDAAKMTSGYLPPKLRDDLYGKGI